MTGIDPLPTLDADRKEGFGRCRLEALFAMSNAYWGFKNPCFDLV
jgi:hypothetical protein